MPRRLTMAVLLISAAASITCSPTAEGPLDPDADSKLRAACPAIAHSCPSGCALVGAHPVDRQNACLLPLQTWGCTPEGLIGLPAIGCSVTPDGTVWVSMDYRLHPLGRHCTTEESSAILFSSCSQAADSPGK